MSEWAAWNKVKQWGLLDRVTLARNILPKCLHCTVSGLLGGISSWWNTLEPPVPRTHLWIAGASLQGEGLWAFACVQRSLLEEERHSNCSKRGWGLCHSQLAGATVHTNITSTCIILLGTLNEQHRVNGHGIWQNSTLLLFPVFHIYLKSSVES